MRLRKSSRSWSLQTPPYVESTRPHSIFRGRGQGADVNVCLLTICTMMLTISGGFGDYVLPGCRDAINIFSSRFRH